MIEQSDCRIIAADHSKFGHSAFVKISDLQVADYIATDKPIPSDIAEELSTIGATVLL